MKTQRLFSNQLAVRSEDFVEAPIFAQAVCGVGYSVARITAVCVLIEDIGRRLPLELLRCSLYQGQQGDVSQSVRGKT